MSLCVRFCFFFRRVCVRSRCLAFPLNQSLARCERVIWLDGCIPMGSLENETEKKNNQQQQPTGCWIFQQFLFYSFTSAFTFDRSFFPPLSLILSHMHNADEITAAPVQRWKKRPKCKNKHLAREFVQYLLIIYVKQRTHISGSGVCVCVHAARRHSIHRKTKAFQ